MNLLTIKVVQEGSLAERVLALRSGVAQVVAELGATDEVRVGVDLVRLKGASEEAEARRALVAQSHPGTQSACWRGESRGSCSAGR